MADLGFKIKTSELPEGNDFTPLPMGKYTVIVSNTSFLPTKKTKKAMDIANVNDYEAYRKINPLAEGFLSLEMDVQDADYAGRKLFHNLNIINDSKQAQDIAAGQLRKILEAFRMEDFSGRTEELHGKRMIVDVVVKPATPYVDATGATKPGFTSNECKGFYPVGATSSTPPTAASTTKGPWGS